MPQLCLNKASAHPHPPDCNPRLSRMDGNPRLIATRVQMQPSTAAERFEALSPPILTHELSKLLLTALLSAGGALPRDSCGPWAGLRAAHGGPTGRGADDRRGG